MSDRLEDIEDDAAHIAYTLSGARRLAWPFAHVRLEAVLPPALFDALRTLPVENGDMEQHLFHDDAASSEQFRYSITVDRKRIERGEVKQAALVRTYNALTHRFAVQAMVGLFAKDLGTAFGTTALPMRAGLTFIEDRTGYELLPHTDVAYKAVTLLIYLADPGANPALGTEIYVPKGSLSHVDDPMHRRYLRDGFTRVTTVPYRPNQGLAFAPNERSFHGVAKADIGDRTRRLLQFQLMIDDPRITRRPLANDAGQ